MDIVEKLLIDVEKTNGLCGYWIRSEDGTQIETIPSGKMITAVDEDEHKNRIYKLLEDNCDLFFCTTVKLKDFEFYPVPMLQSLQEIVMEDISGQLAESVNWAVMRIVTRLDM